MILIAGDSHADYYYVRKILLKAIENNIQNVIICGDFGYWPNDNQAKNFMYCLNKLMKYKNIKLFFVDGNHEDFKHIMKLPQSMVSEIPYIKNCFYIPRGITTTIDERKIMGFGGAVSIDKEYRVVNESWFAEETIKDEQIDNMKDIENIDILITHDAPLNICCGIAGYKNDPESDLNRQQIQKICKIVNPKILCHGHYHRQFKYSYLDIECYGLGCNLDFENYVIL